MGIFCLALTTNRHVHDLTLIFLFVYREVWHARRKESRAHFFWSFNSASVSFVTSLPTLVLRNTELAGSLLVTQSEPLIGPTFSSAARSWRSCPSRHAQRLLVLPCQTTPGTATPSNLPDRHYLCQSRVMDTSAHSDHRRLRERGRHLALG